MHTLIKPYPWIKRAGFPTITWISLINTASNPNADNSERELIFQTSLMVAIEYAPWM